MDISVDLDHTEKRAYSEKIKKFIEKKIQEELFENLSSGIVLNEERILEITENIYKEVINKKLEELVNRVIIKFENQLEVFKKYLIEQNEEIIKLFSSGSNLENVRVEFIRIHTEYKTIFEKLAIKYYEEKGFTAFNFQSQLYYKIPKEILEEIKPILNSKGLKGAPDLIVIDKNKINGPFFFVEVKGNGDSLRKSQIIWYKNHPTYLIKILFIDQVFDKEYKEIRNEGFSPKFVEKLKTKRD